MTIEEERNEVAKEAFGMTLDEAWRKGICISCKEPPRLDSDAGRYEYKSSAMCEICACPSDPFTRVEITGTGLCAVMWATFYDPDLGWYPDIWLHSKVRHDSYDEAEEEAKSWAKREGIKFCT